MEIKTTKEIFEESHLNLREPFNHNQCNKCKNITNHDIKDNCLNCNDNKKWVSLNDLIEYLQKKNENNDKQTGFND